MNGAGDKVGAESDPAQVYIAARATVIESMCWRIRMLSKTIIETEEQELGIWLGDLPLPTVRSSRLNNILMSKKRSSVERRRISLCREVLSVHLEKLGGLCEVESFFVVASASTQRDAVRRVLKS